MGSLHKNSIWELVKFMKGKKTIEYKWVFTKKDDSFINKESGYKTRLVMKDYT